MKKFLIVLVFLYYSVPTYSDTAGRAASVAITTGSLIAVSHLQYQRWLQSELEDWKDPDAQTTTKLFSGCGLLLETRITGNHRNNVVFYGISNPNEQVVVIKPDQASVVFSSGRERTAKFPYGASPIEIKKNWWAKSVVVLPKKREFKAIDSIQINIPIFSQDGTKKVCELKGFIQRDPNIQELKSSFTRYTAFDMGLLFGSNLVSESSSNNIQEKDGFNFTMDINFYPWNEHGFGFSFYYADPSTVAIANIKNYLNDSKLNIYSNSTSFHYAGKSELIDRHNLLWKLGWGTYTIYYHEENQSSYDSKEFINGSLYVGGLGYEWVFSRVDYGYWMGDYSIGIHYNHLILEKKEKNNLNYGGHAGSFLGSFRMGF